MPPQALLETRKKLFTTGQQSCFEQGCLHRDVTRSFFQAFLYRSNAMADLEADVPEMADQAFQLVLKRAAGFLWQQNQQVDVGGGKQLAAPITPYCRQGQRGREVERLPQLLENRIDLLATIAEQGAGIVVLFVIQLKPALIGLDLGPQGCNVAGHQAIQSGFARQPAERVMTS